MIHEVDPNSKVPLHNQVERLLRMLIRQPEYQKGAFLPKEVDLANQLGISRNTVRHGISKLVNEGLLVRKKGVGTKVASRKVSTRLDHWISFSGEMKAKGMEVANYELKAQPVAADEEVAGVFHISPGTRLVKLSRLRGTQEGPILLSLSWFHPRLGITGEEDFSQPLYQMLEKEIGVYPTVSREEISAIAAEKGLASRLEVREGAPILFRKRVVFDSDGKAMEFNKVYYQGEGFSYSIDIERK
ncbi:MAG: GntR family transcriptional regulator [Phaeodactylibacter sp.]|nr:GntR family transcriptional regulator [Phaeodactylibacter sp.]MCB9267256.1 GntR family transcriptional regulator [Lewinellaceae bacterium]MCB9285683.1 GntR family transcriptional regulator [Lewinellaceae bacterium]